MQAFGRFIIDDWWIAIPMFLMSLTGVTLVIWRLMLNSTANTQMNLFLPAFTDKYAKEGVESSLAFCRGRTDIIPKKLYVAGLETSKQGLAAVRRSMANITELEIIPDLNFLLPSILAIAKIATMVGLFGTVISMINVFDLMAKGGDTGEQAKKIGLALFATALGLVTAIPLVFSHVLLKAWVTQFEVRLKSAAQKLLIILQSTKPGSAKAAPAAPPGSLPTSVKPEAVTTNPTTKR